MIGNNLSPFFFITQQDKSTGFFFSSDEGLTLSLSSTTTTIKQTSTQRLGQQERNEVESEELCNSLSCCVDRFEL